MAFSVNDNDFNRITEKLNKLSKVLSNPNDISNPLGKYKFTILMVYEDAVVRAMGSVIAIDYTDGTSPDKNPNKSFGSNYHGNVVIDLKGLGIRQTTWQNLAPFTIQHKRKMGWRMTVWEASGDTKRAVKIHAEDNFVGITSDSPFFKRARLVEYGLGEKGDEGRVPQRALFTIANNVVMSQKEEIAKRIREIILTYVSWGS